MYILNTKILDINVENNIGKKKKNEKSIKV